MSELRHAARGGRQLLPELRHAGERHRQDRRRDRREPGEHADAAVPGHLRADHRRGPAATALRLRPGRGAVDRRQHADQGGARPD